METLVILGLLAFSWFAPVDGAAPVEIHTNHALTDTSCQDPVWDETGHNGTQACTVAWFDVQGPIMAKEQYDEALKQWAWMKTHLNPATIIARM